MYMMCSCFIVYQILFGMKGWSSRLTSLILQMYVSVVYLVSFTHQISYQKGRGDGGPEYNYILSIVSMNCIESVKTSQT